MPDPTKESAKEPANEPEKGLEKRHVKPAIKEYFQLRETIVTIAADDPVHIKAAKDAIRVHRAALENYILSDPYFQLTLEPYECPKNAPEAVRRMVKAGNTMEIGPMSAVAGTISALAVEAMVKAGAKYAIVDNGGDIALINDRPVVVGIYAGQSPIKNLGLIFEPRDSITGICTSAGTVGPSISFGMADAAAVFSDDISLADAAATALGNEVGIGKESVESSFKAVKGVPGIKGALVIQGEYIGMWGEVPKITRADVRYEYITKA
ncbi:MULTISPECIES: UPF0280 family protein [unclassified Methanosarcina]|uniref:UPF0280 family protein n=1 Tax=unclassified Methanosarcina TaxID=2644672 RepID=UPI000615B14F|nr:MULTISPECIES: UPF0280 family protein [unclassified Methanosarcina]AKB19962.1 hypothetical protein MSWHS_3099 [Methanosarcina sp. WWM596]AKB22242.1 hypothetical protein MSWH1_1971 [Methanosarcina sp. WH1]